MMFPVGELGFLISEREGGAWRGASFQNGIVNFPSAVSLMTLRACYSSYEAEVSEPQISASAYWPSVETGPVVKVGVGEDCSGARGGLEAVYSAALLERRLSSMNAVFLFSVSLSTANVFLLPKNNNKCL